MREYRPLPLPSVGYMLIALALAACAGTPEPAMDIDATVDPKTPNVVKTFEVATTTLVPDSAMAWMIEDNAQAAPTLTPTPTSTLVPPTATLTPTPNDSSFTITSMLCSDEQGPDCTKLRLGDDYLTTDAPAIGHLYSCTGKNPNAPGSIENKITWIDFADKTWNFLKKLWLPQGTFSPVTGTYTETISGDNRQISVNNLPVDGKIGDWPMTKYAKLTEIDPNPGIPTSGSFSFSYSDNPSEAPSPTCVSLGAIGVTKNGVIIYNAADGRGEDAVAREVLDGFGGHPARSDYHYHFIPERLDNESLSGGHSGIVGYINDGFPIYGYKGEGGSEMSNDDLDLCHGHKHGTLGYHYHATLEYPYTVGCYMGTPISSLSNGVPPPGGGPMGPP